MKNGEEYYLNWELKPIHAKCTIGIVARYQKWGDDSKEQPPLQELPKKIKWREFI